MWLPPGAYDSFAESYCVKCSHASMYQPGRLQSSTISTTACGLSCVRTTLSTQNSLTSRRGFDSVLLFNMFSYAAAFRVVRVCFSEDEGIVQNLVRIDDDGGGRVEELLACVRRAAWGMLCTDDAGCLEIGRRSCYNEEKLLLSSKQQASRFRKKIRRPWCCKPGTLQSQAPHFATEAA